MIWNKCTTKLPPEGVVVQTKIDDGSVRCEKSLIRIGMWFYLPDLRGRVHYKPTHWRL